MTGTAPAEVLVLDASAVVALLTDGGPAGRRVAERTVGAALLAPTVLPYEVVNVLRRLVRTGTVHVDQGTALAGIVGRLPIELWPFAVVADDVWRWRDRLSGYDAAYVAVARRADAPLLTLDERLARAAGPDARIEVLPTDR
jgi:predicted nucleic acid-binding protein